MLLCSHAPAHLNRQPHPLSFKIIVIFKTPSAELKQSLLMLHWKWQQFWKQWGSCNCFFNMKILGDLVWANFFSFGTLCFMLLCSHAPAHYASTAPSTFFSLGTLVSFCLTFLTGHRGKSNLKQICPHQNGGRSETYLKLKIKMHIDSHVF